VPNLPSAGRFGTLATTRRPASYRFTIGVELTDSGKSYVLELRNGVLVHRAGKIEPIDLVLRMPDAVLPGLLGGSTDGMTVEGDAGVLGRLIALLETPDRPFAIVTP
jgi:alkyl sulfatase BDS1-like metallo-beta-lactamase superfamily hydrolase